MPKQFHVQLFETPVDCESLPPRELLPWADPYIAQLMGQLREEAEAWDFEAKAEADTELEDDLGTDELPEDWHLDCAAFPPVYGGWPLLNDLPPEARHEVA